VVAALRSLPGPSRPRPVHVAVTAMLAVVGVSLLRIVLDYRAHGVAVADFLADAVPAHFTFGLRDVAVDRRGVLHEALVMAEGLTFFFMLTSRAAAVPRRAIAAVVCAATGERRTSGVTLLTSA
jgi:hypothetical protein